MRRMYSKPQLLEAVESESKVNGIKVFENIVDKDGHARFIEGNIILASGVPEGVTLTFGKWSLCGTHLMFVIAGDIPNATEISSGNFAAIQNMPEWIKDKIYRVFNKFIEIKAYTIRADNLSGQQIEFQLVKENDGEINIYTSTLTLTADRHYRAQFDLLIDNE